MAPEPMKFNCEIVDKKVFPGPNDPGYGEPLGRTQLTKEEHHLFYADKVGGGQPTFGFVSSREEWLTKRDELRSKGMPVGIGELRRFKRKVFSSGKLQMWDGARIDHWGFEDEHGIKDFPSTPIRLVAGDLMQTTLESSLRQHTIHWHGIEPDMDNDGVGHTSFEVTGAYTYQWRAHPLAAGTYFYHCHVNTALHVQMGMLGGLIIYPAGTQLDAQRKKPFADAPEAWTYDHEVLWPFYAIDPRWHQLGHDAGVCGEDVGLNRFEPEYFCIGRFSQGPDGTPIEGHPAGSSPTVQDDLNGTLNRQRIAVDAELGETVYVRMANATYFPVDVDFGELDALCIESDGRGFRDRIDLSGLGEGGLVGLPWNATERRLSPAERYGVLVRATKRGTFPVTVTYRHWITGKPVGVARTTITVR